MAFLDIIFHNIQSKAAIYTGGPGAYIANGPNVCDGPANQAGLWGTPMAYGAPAPASAGWGPNVAAPPLPFSGVFFCEGPSYLQYAGGWTIPPIIVAPAPGALGWDVVRGLSPYIFPPNLLCAFLDAPAVPAYPPVPALPVPPAPYFGGNGGVYVLGTGVIYPPGNGTTAPPGSDRYGIHFRTRWNYHTLPATPISGLFAHTKNTNADPGTQIAALCRMHPNDIVFGDLNLNMRRPRIRESLVEAVRNTHSLLVLRSPGGHPYETRPTNDTALDYALIPNAHVADVEIWGRLQGGAAPHLWTNGSDHSVMRLRIHVA